MTVVTLIGLAAGGYAPFAYPRQCLLTDTLVGDDGAIEDGDVGDKRPNDQRVAPASGTACNEGGGVGGVPLCVAHFRPLRFRC